MTVRFRAASAADAAAIVGLVESGYRGEASRQGWTTEADLLDGQRTDTDEVLGVIGEQASRLIVAERDGGLVGCCHVRREVDGSGYFGMFAVKPALQGMGVGRAMVTEAERFARDELGCTRLRMMVLSVRDELIAWYQRLGYAATGVTRPFPYGNVRFGIPRRPDLAFAELAKSL